MKTQQVSRYDKIFSENFYLLNKSQEYNKLCFNVSGSTSNIYKVNIYFASKMIFCNCPDAKKWAKSYGVICKHCCFVLFKILKLDIDTYQPYLERVIFTQEEIDSIKLAFENINISNNQDFINEEYIKKYKLLLEQEKPTNQNTIVPKETQDTMCCICYDDFENITDINKNKQCKVCQTILHKDCLNKWLRSGNNTCPYCRSIIKNTHNSYYLNLFN